MKEKKKEVQKPVLKNKDLLELWVGLSSVAMLNGTVKRSDKVIEVFGKFQAFVGKNINQIKADAETVQKMPSPTESFTKYDNERIELCKKHALKDDKTGEPLKRKLDENREEFIMDPSQTADFNAALDKLQAKHKAAIDEQKAKDEAYKAYLEEPLENYYSFRTIKESEIHPACPGAAWAIFDLFGLIKE